MNKYIKKEDLSEAMKVIADLAVASVDKYITEVCIRSLSDVVTMRVVVRNADNYVRLAELEYTIAEGYAPNEVACEVFNEAYAANKNYVTPSNDEN